MVWVSGAASRTWRQCYAPGSPPKLSWPRCCAGTGTLYVPAEDPRPKDGQQIFLNSARSNDPPGKVRLLCRHHARHHINGNVNEPAVIPVAAPVELDRGVR